MNIKSDCRETVTKICLNIELDNEDDIKTFQNILTNSKYTALSKSDILYGNYDSYDKELKMIEKIEKQLR